MYPKRSFKPMRASLILDTPELKVGGGLIQRELISKEGGLFTNQIIRIHKIAKEMEHLWQFMEFNVNGRLNKEGGYL